MKGRIGLLIAVLVFAAAAFSQERYVRPVDDAKKNPSFLAFRIRLIAAAERKDAKFILAMLDPKIELSFGGDSGIGDFRRIWKIDRKDSPFWEVFLSVITNGGTFYGEGKNKLNSFSAPYLFSVWPEDLDAFEYAAIIGSDVRLRKTPGTDGEIIGKLSYNVVKIEEEPSSDDPGVPVWRSIKTLGGMSGYVHRDYVRSSIDYRAGFEKKRGRWTMTYFIAGD